jgi:hypothetical protein
MIDEPYEETKLWLAPTNSRLQKSLPHFQKKYDKDLTFLPNFYQTFTLFFY